MKSIHLIAALALPLAACGSPSKATVQPVIDEQSVTVDVQESRHAAQSIADPLAQIEVGCEADARSLGLFQRFGLSATCIAAASVQDLPGVAGALVSQDKATLVSMCNPEAPQAFVMPRGTWLEVVGTGTESVQFGARELEVEIVTCEIIAAPEDRHVGHSVTMPIGWIQGRIVVE
ncbi:MAG: hypothetical protein R3F49_13580 [Planctomycetota bacterium]